MSSKSKAIDGILVHSGGRTPLIPLIPHPVFEDMTVTVDTILPVAAVVVIVTVGVWADTTTQPTRRFKTIVVSVATGGAGIIERCQYQTDSRVSLPLSFVRPRKIENKGVL